LGVAALTLGPFPARESEASSRQAVETTLFSATGFGATHQRHAIAASGLSPAGLATSAVYIASVPGFASGGCAWIARMRRDVTSESSGPRFGLHARNRATTTAERVVMAFIGPPAPRARRPAVGR